MFRRGGLGHKLLNLAIEAVALAAGGLGPPVVGAIAQRAIDHFGPQIVEKWLLYSRTMTRYQWEEALTEMAAIPAEEVQQLVTEEIEDMMPSASPEQKQMAIKYLTAIPGTVRRSLLSNTVTGALSVPKGISTDNPPSLLQLLPIDPPPYVTPCDLADTPFRLEELIGVGGFGAVYRAASPYEQNLPRAIKFCLDPNMKSLFQHELALLERLRSDAARLPAKIVPLYGYSLETNPPFLVYEYVPGGDLHNLLTALSEEDDQGVPAAAALALMRDITEPLAYTHDRGLVHRDLKPANILIRSASPTLADIARRDIVKLTDFGIGGVAAVNAVQQSSRLGQLGGHMTTTDQVSILRGSGTPLYMSREQRRGDAPDPRHDIYSLGVIWYQLLMGSPSVTMDPDWEEMLMARDAPPEHIDLIKRCIGRFEARPVNAAKLLDLLPASVSDLPVAPPEPETPTRRFCIGCGTQLTPNLRFCRSCGREL